MNFGKKNEDYKRYVKMKKRYNKFLVGIFDLIDKDSLFLKEEIVIILICFKFIVILDL